MKLEDLVKDRFVAAIDALSKAQLPTETAFKISAVMEAMRLHATRYSNKRAELLNKYGQKDKSGKLRMNKEKTVYMLKDIEGFKKEYDALIAEEVSVPKISLTDLKDLKVSAQLLDSIRPILTP